MRLVSVGARTRLDCQSTAVLGRVSSHKMASAASFLDDIISNTEVSESAVSALVGSLESQLTSSTSAAQQPPTCSVEAGATNVNASVHAFPSTAQQPVPHHPAPTPTTAPSPSLALAGNGLAAGTTTTTVTSAGSVIPSQPPPLVNNIAATAVQHHQLVPNGNTTGSHRPASAFP